MLFLIENLSNVAWIWRWYQILLETCFPPKSSFLIFSPANVLSRQAGLR